MKQIQIYIFITVGFLVAAVAATLFVWATIQSELKSTAPISVATTTVRETPVLADVATSAESGSTLAQPVEVAETIESVVPAEGIPLRTLALTTEQISLLESFGIDVATFVITPTMVACAESAIGADRVAYLMAGGSPGLIEAGKLFGCMSS